MSTISSMTGFAVVQASAGNAVFTVTVKSVNHRSLDLALRLPPGMDALEADLRRILKERLRRGHVELGLAFEKAATSVTKAELQEPVLAAYVAAFHRASVLYGLTREPDIHELLKMPGVLSAEAGNKWQQTPELEMVVLAAVAEAVTGLQRVREAEGAALAAELHASMARLGTLVEETSRLSTDTVEAHYQRLRLRLQDLMTGTPLNNDRVLAEAALLADRGDVEEELVRLRTHTARFLDLLKSGGELGRQLDFLLQELNREATTLLSKTGGAHEAGLRVTELGLAMKLEIERAREQVQNLE